MQQEIWPKRLYFLDDLVDLKLQKRHIYSGNKA